MTRHPEWLCHDPDEPEDTLWYAAATAEDARALADAERPGIDWCVVRITPQMRRRWRYHERREEGTLPVRKGRSKPCSPEAEAWYSRLGMMATMTMHDEQGRLRCESCRRYVTLDDLAGARTSSIGGGVCVDYGASCRRCRGVPSQIPTIPENNP